MQKSFLTREIMIVIVVTGAKTVNYEKVRGRKPIRPFYVTVATSHNEVPHILILKPLIQQVLIAIYLAD